MNSPGEEQNGSQLLAQEEKEASPASARRKPFKTEYKSKFTPFDDYSYNGQTDSFVRHHQQELAETPQDHQSPLVDFQPTSNGLGSSRPAGEPAEEPWYKEVVRRKEQANEYRFKSEVGHNSPLLGFYTEPPVSERTSSPAAAELIEPAVEKHEQEQVRYKFTPGDYKSDHLIAHMANNNNFALSRQAGGEPTPVSRRPAAPRAATAGLGGASSRARSQSSRRQVAATSAGQSTRPAGSASATKSQQTTPTRSAKPKPAPAPPTTARLRLTPRSALNQGPQAAKQPATPKLANKPSSARPQSTFGSRSVPKVAAKSPVAQVAAARQASRPPIARQTGPVAPTRQPAARPSPTTRTVPSKQPAVKTTRSTKNAPETSAGAKSVMTPKAAAAAAAAASAAALLATAGSEPKEAIPVGEQEKPAEQAEVGEKLAETSQQNHANEDCDLDNPNVLECNEHLMMAFREKMSDEEQPLESPVPAEELSEPLEKPKDEPIQAQVPEEDNDREMLKPDASTEPEEQPKAEPEEQQPEVLEQQEMQHQELYEPQPQAGQEKPEEVQVEEQVQQEQLYKEEPIESFEQGRQAQQEEAQQLFGSESSRNSSPEVGHRQSEAKDFDEQISRDLAAKLDQDDELTARHHDNEQVIVVDRENNLTLAEELQLGEGKIDSPEAAAGVAKAEEPSDNKANSNELINGLSGGLVSAEDRFDSSEAESAGSLARLEAPAEVLAEEAKPEVKAADQDQSQKEEEELNLNDEPYSLMGTFSQEKASEFVVKLDPLEETNYRNYDSTSELEQTEVGEPASQGDMLLDLASEESDLLGAPEAEAATVAKVDELPLISSIAKLDLNATDDDQSAEVKPATGSSRSSSSSSLQATTTTPEPAQAPRVEPEPEPEAAGEPEAGAESEKVGQITKENNDLISKYDDSLAAAAESPRQAELVLSPELLQMASPGLQRADQTDTTITTAATAGSSSLSEETAADSPILVGGESVLDVDSETEAGEVKPVSNRAKMSIDEYREERVVIEGSGEQMDRNFSSHSNSSSSSEISLREDNNVLNLNKISDIQ